MSQQSNAPASGLRPTCMQVTSKQADCGPHGRAANDAFDPRDGLGIARPACGDPTLAKDQPGAITVFVAKKIVTMDPTQPTATAVAVRDGQILSVGSLPDLEPWLKNNKHTIDEQFKDKC